MIVLLATNVFVSRWDNSGGFFELELVELGVQDVLDALVRIDASRKSAAASRFQAIFAVVVPEAQEAQAGAVGLLWVLTRAHQRLDELRRLRADGLCPVCDPLRRPLLMLLMSRRHVFRDGGVPPRRLDTGMGGLCWLLNLSTKFQWLKSPK